MNHNRFLLLSCMIIISTPCALTSADKNLYRLDGIAVTLYGQESTMIIAESELERTGIEGRIRTLDDLIFENLVCDDARAKKYVADPEAIEKRLRDLQKQNHLSDAQLRELFKQAGYTFEEGRQEFEAMNTIRTMLDFKINSQLQAIIIPEEDILAYYNAHPEIVPATYIMEKASFTFRTPEERDILFDQLVAFTKGNAQDVGNLDVIWSAPFTLTKPELPEDKKFFGDMPNGAISHPIEFENKLEIYRMIENKPEHRKTLEEMRRKISNMLLEPYYDKLMDDYKKELLSQAAIVYTNPTFAPKQQEDKLRTLPVRPEQASSK